MRKILRRLWWIITAPFRLIGWIVKRIAGWFRRVGGEIHSFFSEDEVEDTPLPDTIAKAVSNPYGLLEHLDALRKHLFRAVGYMVVTTALSLLFMHQILNFITQPLPGGMSDLRAIEVTESIGTVMRVALLSGFSLAFPLIALELWLFIAPGLISVRSRMIGLLAIPVATLFFVGGMAFVFYVMLPVALPFLLNFMGIKTIPRPSNYISFTTGLLFWIGLSFEFPLVIYVMARLGLVKAKVLWTQWRVAIVIIAVVAAAITPTVDPVNMSIAMGPMILLYFLSAILASLAQRQHSSAQEKRAAEGA